MYFSWMFKVNIYSFILIICIFLSCAPPKGFLREPSAMVSRQEKKDRDNVKTESFTWDSSKDDDPYLFVADDQANSVQQPYAYRKNRPIKNNKQYNKPVSYYSKKYKPKIKSKNKYKTKGKYLFHKVKRRETLYGISRKYGVPVKTICRNNKISNSNKIKIGMLLKIPVAAKRTYVSKRKPVKRKPKGKKKTYKRRVALNAPKFVWPIKKIKRVKSDGIDGVKSIGVVITGNPGALVVTSAPGVVKKVGYMRGFGNYIMITHKNRYITVYANLEMVNVAEGEKVSTGKSIGKLDSRNNNLHFQINHAGKSQRPLRLLPKRKI